MGKMIAYCGTTCTECPAYIATQFDDRELLVQTAQRWTEEFQVSIAPADILCDGCKAESDRLCSHCHECVMRICGRERGVASCAVCPEYTCEHLQAVLAQAPAVGEALARIRREAGIR